jgi:putative MATE family efflux protein
MNPLRVEKAEASAGRTGPSLTSGPIVRTLLSFSLPILATYVLQSLSLSINAIWVGRYLGTSALAATSNAHTIISSMFGLMFGSGMALNILVGQAVGARDVDRLKRTVGTGASFFAVMSLVVTVLGSFGSTTILRWMHTPVDALPYAVPYLRLVSITLGLVFMAGFLAGILRGAGDPRTPMRYSALTVCLDIVLNPVLIFGVGPIPKLGVAGSGLASILANAIGLAALLRRLYSQNHELCLGRGELGYLRVDRAIVAALVKKGLPIGAQLILPAVAALIMMSLVNRFTSQTAAAYGASAQLWSYIQMPALAVGVAASTITAQNVGAGLWHRIRTITFAGITINLGMTAVGVLALWLFGRRLLGLFLADGGALAIGLHLNAIVVWSFFPLGVSLLLMSVVRSTGAVGVPLAILVVSLLGVRVPFALAFLHIWQADAIWWSFSAGSLVSLLLMGIYYRFGTWRSARML